MKIEFDINVEELMNEIKSKNEDYAYTKELGFNAALALNCIKDAVSALHRTDAIKDIACDWYYETMMNKHTYAITHESTHKSTHKLVKGM